MNAWAHPGPDLAGGRPGAQPGHNFDLKSGGTKLEAPKVPQIEMSKASRGMMNRERHPSQPTRGLGKWSNYIIMYERHVKYGER